jgi:hypothetical protein
MHKLVCSVEILPRNSLERRDKLLNKGEHGGPLECDFNGSLPFF